MHPSYHIQRSEIDALFRVLTNSDYGSVGSSNNIDIESASENSHIEQNRNLEQRLEDRQKHVRRGILGGAILGIGFVLSGAETNSSDQIATMVGCAAIGSAAGVAYNLLNSFSCREQNRWEEYSNIGSMIV